MTFFPIVVNIVPCLRGLQRAYSIYLGSHLLTDHQSGAVVQTSFNSEKYISNLLLYRTLRALRLDSSPLSDSFAASNAWTVEVPDEAPQTDGRPGCREWWRRDRSIAKNLEETREGGGCMVSVMSVVG